MNRWWSELNTEERLLLTPHWGLEPTLVVTGLMSSGSRIALLPLLHGLDPPDAVRVGWAVVESLQRNQEVGPDDGVALHIMLNPIGVRRSPLNGRNTPNITRPVVFWWGGNIRALAVQRVLALEGYLHHSRREEWQRNILESQALVRELLEGWEPSDVLD